MLSMRWAAVGRSGQQLVLFKGSGVNTNTQAAVSRTPDTPLVVQDLGFALGALPGAIGGTSGIVAADDGSVIVQDLPGRHRRRWVDGVWQPQESMPVGALPPGTRCHGARNGNLLCATLDSDSFNGAWLSYDSATNSMIQSLPTQASGAGWLFGVPVVVPGSLPASAWPLLSTSGVGVLDVYGPWSTLPSASSPSGVGNGRLNHWVLYSK
jgi:hypothetical protein